MKKWIAMVLALIVCLGVFTACKKNAAQEPARKEAVPAQPVLGDELENAKQQIAGAWRSEDGSYLILVDFKGDVCTVDIEAQIDGEWSYWHFSGDLAKTDAYQVMGVDCSKYEVTKENGFSQELVYEDGVSTIVLKDGVITWSDQEENAGKGLTFKKES